MTPACHLRFTASVVAVPFMLESDFRQSLIFSSMQSWWCANRPCRARLMFHCSPEVRSSVASNGRTVSFANNALSQSSPVGEDDTEVLETIEFDLTSVAKRGDPPPDIPEENRRERKLAVRSRHGPMTRLSSLASRWRRRRACRAAEPAAGAGLYARLRASASCGAAAIGDDPGPATAARAVL